MYLSIRSLRSKVNSAKLIRDLILGLGTGGGHEIMAGGKIPDVSSNSRMSAEETITKRLLNILSLSDVKEKRFIH
jgi:hypothetical protein